MTRLQMWRQKKKKNFPNIIIFVGLLSQLLFVCAYCMSYIVAVDDVANELLLNMVFLLIIFMLNMTSLFTVVIGREMNESRSNKCYESSTSTHSV